jgi:hypothetical protein
MLCEYSLTSLAELGAVRLEAQEKSQGTGARFHRAAELANVGSACRLLLRSAFEDGLSE